MKTKIFLLSAAVVAVGLFALPATVSMFAGQHAWYGPKDQGIPCEKCHWLEYEEMRSGEYTTHKPHVNKNGDIRHFDCEECHNVTMDVDYYYHTGDVGGHTPAHAATIVSCLACHGDNISASAMHTLGMRYHMYADEVVPPYDGECEKCHSVEPDDDGIVRLGGDAFIDHVDTELTNDRSAHKAFYLAMQGEDTALSDANEACLGCHSRTGVNITWTRNSYVSYHVTCDKSGYNVSWNTSDNLGTNRTVFGSTSGWD